MLSAALYTDITMGLKDIDLTIVNPYSGHFIGYKIDKGKLSVDVTYKIEDRKLDAKQHFVVDQLELGDRVESPDAVHGPVKLAVALLKDRHGVIDIDLPMNGSIDDPQVPHRSADLEGFRQPHRQGRDRTLCAAGKSLWRRRTHERGRVPRRQRRARHGLSGAAHHGRQVTQGAAAAEARCADRVYATYRLRRSWRPHASTSSSWRAWPARGTERSIPTRRSRWRWRTRRSTTGCCWNSTARRSARMPRCRSRRRPWKMPSARRPRPTSRRSTT